MLQPPIAPADIRLLLRTHWEGIAKAWEVLTTAPMTAAFEREVRWGRQADNLRRADSNLQEHLQAGVLATLEYAARTQGLAVPPAFWDRIDVAPFVARVFRHRLVDRHRREWRLEVILDPEEVDRYATPSPAAGAGPPNPERLREYRRRLDDGSLRMGHALAFGAAYDLALVEEVVDRLEAGARPDPALLRPPRDTAQLLQEWLDRVPGVPVPCRDRRGLAWVVRSTNREDPGSWQGREPTATATAMDLLLKWQQRAEATLPARLFGPAVVLGVARMQMSSHRSSVVVDVVVHPRQPRRDPGLDTVELLFRRLHGVERAAEVNRGDVPPLPVAVHRRAHHRPLRLDSGEHRSRRQWASARHHPTLLQGRRRRRSRCATRRGSRSRTAGRGPGIPR